MKSHEFHRNLWKSMKMHENLWKYLKSHVVLWKFLNIYRIYLLWEKKMGYILYSKNINASHICPPKRNILFWKSGFSGKYGLWFVKILSKSWILWNHEMIPRSIQTFCPRRFLIKPQENISVWQKCWNPFFPKVWASILNNIW